MSDMDAVEGDRWFAALPSGGAAISVLHALELVDILRNGRLPLGNVVVSVYGALYHSQHAEAVELESKAPRQIR